MNIFLLILKWLAIIAFFPLSLLVIAYFNVRKEKKEYYNQAD